MKVASDRMALKGQKCREPGVETDSFGCSDVCAEAGLDVTGFKNRLAVVSNPKPFKWTRSADDILATIERFCLRTLDTAERQKKIIKTSESGH